MSITRISENTRRKCNFPNCKRWSRNKGFRKNKTRWDHFCVFHHKKTDAIIPWEKEKIKNDRCINCGWNKGSCDRHRINPAKGYTIKNVRILCPNCHRLVTEGLLEIN